MARASTARRRHCSRIAHTSRLRCSRPSARTHPKNTDMGDARIRSISGPVLHALAQGSFSVGEAVEVGDAHLPGEIIRLDGDSFVAQVYEDTTGLKPGDRVRGTGAPLSVPLGPGLPGRIYDGLLRRRGAPGVGPGARVRGTGAPLAVPLGPGRLGRGYDGLLRRLDADGDAAGVPGASSRERFVFAPSVTAGSVLAPGTAFGEVEGSAHARRCLLPPDTGGEVVRIATHGEVGADATVLVLRDDAGREHAIGLFHRWPVRRPRPVARRLPADEPLITGQRILDTLFPVARGGRAAIPGGFGTGKTVLQETLAKWCHADIIVYRAEER